MANPDDRLRDLLLTFFAMETIWIIAFVILTIVALFFIAMYFRCTVVNVPASRCGASYGLYAVDPGKTGSIINTCGGDGHQPCTFTVNTLQDAVMLCDDNSASCLAFQFSEIRREMSYISPTVALTPATVTNVFRRNVNPVRVTTST